MINKRKGLISMFDKILNDYLKEECGEMENEILTSLSSDEIRNIYEYGCCSSAPGAFTYYYQTKAFFDKHSEECLEILQLAINDYMIDPNDFNFTKNNITWLCVELTVSNFMSYYENNEYLYNEEEE